MADAAEFVAPAASMRGREESAYETRGDELDSEHLFFDQVELLAQLGLM